MDDVDHALLLAFFAMGGLATGHTEGDQVGSSETNSCSKSAQVRVNGTHFNTSCIGGAVVIILLIRLWRSWQDADKAAEPPKPNTPGPVLAETQGLCSQILVDDPGAGTGMP